MKILKILSLSVLTFVLFSFNSFVKAEIIGYANFRKVEQDYNYAKKMYKEHDAKVLELQQYVIDKDKQFKAIESPIQRKNFEEKTLKDFKTKEENIAKAKVKIEEEVFANMMYAAKEVAKEKKIDVVLDYGVVFAGGVDLTSEIINYLNTKTIPKNKK